ncbi:MAG: cytochrome c3 family protein, partial [Verrucomicrobiaceae bacterium]|nr:cytochrome c3 family protein [Verrucomicrobiaceae bacterium]
MVEPLQQTQHTGTTYLRPNQRWTCGRECEGMCALGPSARGRCRAGAKIDGPDAPRVSGECIPVRGQYNKVTGATSHSDRWFCTRPVHLGGACPSGPLPDGSCCRSVLPCRPRASLRRKRGLVSLLVFAASVGIVLILFARKPSELAHPLNPGPLSNAHSTAAISCGECHSSSFASGNQLPISFSVTALADSGRCLECHTELGNPDEGRVFSPHTLPLRHSRLLTEKAHAADKGKKAGPPATLALASLVAGDHESIACAACHSEHRGKFADNKAISDTQCQVCHVEQFRSFTSGHPEFTSFPYRRKTRIFFDHTAHIDDFFKREEVKEFSKTGCTDCHHEDVNGATMLTDGFAKSCGDCHEKTTRLGEWEIFAFPKVDRRQLNDHLPSKTAKLLEEKWGGAAGREMSPLLKLLVAEGGKDISDALAILEDSGLSLRSLRKADAGQKAAAVKIVTSILESVYASDGGDSLRNSLADTRLLAGASPESRVRIGRAVGDIFAQLSVQEGKSGDGVVRLPTDSGGMFTFVPETGSFSYMPRGHADPVIRAFIDTAGKAAGSLSYADDLFESVADHLQGTGATGPGRCLKCHTADKHDDGSFSVNWLSAAGDPGGRPITRFSHRSHVRLPELMRPDDSLSKAACVSCHVLDRSVEGLRNYQTGFSGINNNLNLFNPYIFKSGFKDLKLVNCADCHTEQRAGNGCLLCHNYHVAPDPMVKFQHPFQLVMPRAKPAVKQPVKSEADEPEEDGSDLLLPDKDTDKESSLLIPQEKEEEGESLLIPREKEEEGELLLIPQEKEEEGESLLIPQEKEEEGESLL